MKSVSRVCENCGEKILGDAPKGLCPACALETGLGPPTHEAVAGVDSSAVAAYSAEAAAKAGSTKADDPDRPASPMPATTRAAEMLGKFGDFEIARREDGSTWELGRGGMGVTYRARDNVLHRSVALKVIEVPPEAGNSEVVRERFLREARAAAALRHPNVAAVYHFGTVPKPDRCYYAMELVEGETLEARVRREGPLKVAQVLEIGVQVTRALIAAANQGLIHRDLKPANIMLTRSEDSSAGFEVKVIDFGLAKVTAESFGEMDLTHGGFVGTPNFASPEQFESGPVDVRSDIYSLGATLWFALTGKTPFAGRDIEEIRSAQKSNALPVEQLKAARVPPSLRSLLKSMLAFEPAARPGVQDLAAQLRRCSALADIEMAADVKKEIQLEIAHVLFIDIVGYSKLSINEEQAAVDELTQIVRSTEQFQKAETAERLIKIPSGDGMALVFYTTPEAPVRCAMQISRALKEHPRVHIRMGIHSGPVSGVVDVTGRSNLAGAGLNLAQRVMKCGDAGHILISKRVAEDLSEFDEWRPLLHDLGRCEVKHGVQVTVVNLCSDDMGNRQLPQKFQTFRKQRTRVRWAEVAAALLLLAGIVAAFVLVSKKSARSTSIAPEKSIAVLPLENLTEEKENAYFADGIQDELLSNLAKIKDLKVISRTSVMQYKGGITRNLKEIAQQLGVSKVVEGSVRRSGNHIRVSVQLIDALTDRHIWSENYDRTLADSLAMQGELATEIAASMGATLSPQEKARVEAKPTNNADAYDAYLRARSFPGGSHLEGGIRLFQEAVKLDPNFVLAWAHLSSAQSLSYWVGTDPRPERLAAAKDSLDRALALDPNLPEVHLALGNYLYHGPHDYTGALAEFQQAEKGLPNNADVIEAIAVLQRRLGHWDEAIAEQRRLVELDPRSTHASWSLAGTYRMLRRFPEALATVDRVLARDPTNVGALSQKLEIFLATGNLQAAEQLLLTNPQLDPFLRALHAMFQRRYAAAIEILSKALVTETDRNTHNIEKLLLGLSQQRAGDVAAARATYEDAVQDLKRQLDKAAPDSFAAGETHAFLGCAYAGLGEAASAIAEGQKAMALHPTSKDPVEGPDEEDTMADIYALLGDADHAIPILKRLLQIPYAHPITPALLRLDPVWDQIRNDPRFQELAAEKTP